MGKIWNSETDITRFGSGSSSQMSHSSLIHRGNTYCIYRARLGNRTVILKALCGEGEDKTETTSLYEESQIISLLSDVKGVSRLIAVGEFNGKKALLLEDAGPRTLEECFRRGLPSLKEFLDLTIELVEVIAKVHQHQIIHRDINPSNIVMDDSNRMTLIDFELAAKGSRLKQIERSLKHPFPTWLPNR